MRNHLNTIIIAITIIITAAILGGAWKSSHTRNESINVNGLSTQDFISDLIVWEGYYTSESTSTKEAYVQLKKDAEVIKKYLLDKGLKEKEIIFSSVNINTNYEYVSDKDGNSSRKFKGYTLTQNVTIESKEVDKVETISREVSELIDLGVNFISYPPQYFYTKLSELKISMLSKATEDARNRADVIATNSKASLGSLIKANMGIFQITAQNGNEDYTYGGVFNTSSKNKTASVTVRLEFGIK
ncbi:MAG TPA: SIMPL domain-containing protein [Bacteroidales bacterium]|nr:SIMPL domain-containing protein [Bacteroidales bacterium]HPS16199.1 SIMPL domain-containing protein [Bacteroidales bacterium]